MDAVRSDPGNAFRLNLTETEAANDAALARCSYPELAKARLDATAEGSWGPALSASGNQHQNPIARFELEGWVKALRRYRENFVAVPAVDDSGTTFHPLMAWWVTLFGASMVTRYEPEGWQRTIDVNTSPLTVPSEHLLDSAVEGVPLLILNVLDQSRDVRYAPGIDVKPTINRLGRLWSSTRSSTSWR